MVYALVSLAAVLTSGLTFFSGFGLGTLLLPVFSLFFDLPTAIGLTAVVHFLNNLFKLFLLGRKADGKVMISFGGPAVLAAFLGARALDALSGLEPLFLYQAFGRSWAVLPVKLTVGLLMAVFALLEVMPRFDRLSFDRKYLPLGGLISGFFGGLSGHQGALRSAFLIRCGLSKESFIASGVAVACLVDVTRLGVYAARLSSGALRDHSGLLACAVLSAFLGTWLGNRLLAKVTLGMVRWSVAVLLLGVAMGLAAGLI